MRTVVSPGNGSRAPWGQWIETLESRRLLAANPLKDGGGDANLRAAMSIQSVRVLAPPVKVKAPKGAPVVSAPLIAPVVQTYSGALNGKIVYTSGGHGWQWSTGIEPDGYTTDRGDNFEIVEDFGNQEQMSFYADYALRAGATVVPMRPVGHQLNEVVLDNDSAAVTYAGTWSNSTTGTRWYDEDYGAVADGTRYRFASTTPGGTTTATYTPNIPQAGLYPVYTWVTPSGNRTNQLYRINHTGGQTDVRVDHRMVGNGWVYLGSYSFNAGSSATAGAVQIRNDAPAGGNVIADAIRFGNGMGDYVDSPAPGPSGHPREEENSYAWLSRGIGLGVTPSAVLGPDNVSAPSNMALHMNQNTNPFGTSVYIGFHSNAGGGRGAVGLIDTDVSERTPHQADLALYTGRQINADMQALNGTFEHDWSTRNANTQSTFTGEFGEINLGTTAEMDATIIEVGFHDSQLDAELMRDPKVRDQLARSTYEATLEYFDNWGGLTAPASQPAAPLSPRAGASATGDVTVSWVPPVARAGGPAAATSYRVYVSRDGKGFGKLADVAAASYTIPAADLDGDAYYFRVAAINAGGESPMSYAVGARKNGAGGGGGTNRILIVNGFDRFDRTGNVRSTYLPAPDDLTDRVRPLLNNGFNYVAAAGEAIEAYTAGGVALGFDSVQNEHVNAALLAGYRTVIWLAGEESTEDETFSTIEQTAVSNFISGGGTLFVSGSEIGWDLDRPTGPTAADRTFYNNTLKADYVGDDAGTYNATAAAGSIFAGMASLSFASQSTVYNAEFPDVLGASAGSTAALNYSGGTGGIAATQWANPAVGSGGAKVVNMAFPFETITLAARRNDVMTRVLNFFQTAVSETPGIPDLVAASDLGNSSTDNVTNVDNSSAGKQLEFDVPGTVAGAIVRLFADGVQIGSATGTAGTTRVTTNGALDLSDGARVITARQEEANKSDSATSATLGVAVDTVGPSISAYAVNGGTAQRSRVTSLGVTFDESVWFSSNPFTLTRRSDGLVVVPTTANPSGDGSTWLLSFSGAGTESGSLADGVWDLSVAGGNTADVAGNALTVSGPLELHRRFGDIDANRIVNNLDYGHFRNTFGKSVGEVGYEAAFDYDANGIVNNLDYGQFRNRFGISM